MKTIARNLSGLILGFVVGWILMPASLFAQTPTQDGSAANPYLITQTGGWNKSLKCAGQSTWTISVDGSIPVAAIGVTYTANTGADAATYPFIALFPQSQMPTTVRAIGPHALTFSQPGVTITLADGVTQYTFAASTYSENVKTLADNATGTPPKDNGWKKIIGTIAAVLKALFHLG